MVMRIAVGQAARATHEYLAFARQIGAAGVQFNTPDLPGERRWEAGDLLALRERVESYGLRLEAIENLPNSFYTSAMFGLPGRDEEIEQVITTVANLGRAGIPVLGFHWMPTSVWRTAVAPEGRGGAVISAFDLDVACQPGRAGDIYVARRDRRVEDQKDSWTRGALFDLPGTRDDAAMWASFEYFIRSVAPAAEEAGICLAVHPDDPPVGELGGVARIFRDVAALRRAADFWPGPGFGIELCLGTVSEMGGQAAVLDAIGYLAPGARSPTSTCGTCAAPSRRSPNASWARGTTTRRPCCARCAAKGSTGSSSMITLPHWSATRPTATAAGPSPWATSRG